MFKAICTIFGTEPKMSGKGKKYHIIAIDKGTDVLKLYYGQENLPFALQRGDEVEIDIDIDNYGKPIITSIG